MKLNDDLMSAIRIAVMARRFAKPVPIGIKWSKINNPSMQPQSRIAKGVDFNIWTGEAS